MHEVIPPLSELLMHLDVSGMVVQKVNCTHKMSKFLNGLILDLMLSYEI